MIYMKYDKIKSDTEQTLYKILFYFDQNHVRLKFSFKKIKKNQQQKQKIKKKIKIIMNKSKEQKKDFF